MPIKTQLTAFNIDDISNDGTRFTMQITYFYNYDVNSQSYTNTETIYFNIPSEEVSVNRIDDTTAGVSLMCEINSIDKCILRYTNDMVNPQGQYNDPAILYQFMVDQVL